MIENKLEWESKTRYDVIKEKTRCRVSGVVESGHSFGPFGEVIHGENNVFVTIAGGGITSHKVDAPFAKRDSGNDRVKKSGGSSGFVGVELTLRTSFHDMNAIVKQGRPKVTGPDNLLSRGYTRKMPPTGATVAVV
jgi:hypothetical protein